MIVLPSCIKMDFVIYFACFSMCSQCVVTVGYVAMK